MKTKIIVSFLLLVVVLAVVYYVSILGEKSDNFEDTTKLYVYAEGKVNATILDLVINETNVEPIEMTDGTTGEKTFGPSVFYTIDIKLKINSTDGIDSKYLKAGDEIVLHYGWEATKPSFDKSEIINASIELVGVREKSAYWRFEGPHFQQFE